jgi:hypothetical protein
MYAVALEAQKRLGFLQKIVDHRPMGFMAIIASLKNRLMLVGKRALIFRMAIETEVLGGHALRLEITRSAMGFVAVCANHLSFPHRVVRGGIKTGLNVTMTVIAQIGLCLSQGRGSNRMSFPCRGGSVNLFRSGSGSGDMYLMAVNAGNTIHGMLTAAPFHWAAGFMAFQTDSRYRFRSEFLRVQYVGGFFGLSMDTA